MTSEQNEPTKEQPPLTRYSDADFFGRSAVFGIILSSWTYWLTDAAGWQAYTIMGIGLLVFIAISMQQATVIENGVMLIFIAMIVWGLSTTDYFGFHWSILILGLLGAFNGAGGRESHHQHRYRMAYGDEEFEKKYRTR